MSWYQLGAKMISFERAPTRPEDLEAQCAICCSKMQDPALGGGCAHHFCQPCLLQWTETKPTCPTCRAPVWAVVLDREYARAIGAESNTDTKTPPAQTTKKAEVTPSTRQNVESETNVRTVRVSGPAGLVLTQRGTQCIVSKCILDNGAHKAGLRPGEVVIKVNGASVREHSTAIAFIEKRCAVGDCEITVQAPRRSPLAGGAAALSRYVNALALSNSAPAPAPAADEPVRCTPEGIVPISRQNAVKCAVSFEKSQEDLC